MAFDHEIICKECGSEYELSFDRISMRDKDYLSCEVCGAKLYSWNEAKTWTARLIKKGGRESDEIR